MAVSRLFLSLITAFLVLEIASACSEGACKQGDGCSKDSDCGPGLYCFNVTVGPDGSRCVRSTATNLFSLVNNSLPLNKYAFLTAHNAFSIDDGTPPVPLRFTNQEDSITQQLNNGVRALMLDVYDYQGDVWQCHSEGGVCYDVTKFAPLVNTLREVEAFLSKNPSEIVTVILEDYVNTTNGLTKVFKDAGLMKYWFPLSEMPKNGEDWPLVSDMVAKNQRLLVFTSAKDKESSEGIAYQWNYMVENQYGDEGMKWWQCVNRSESSQLNDTGKSLVLVNYFADYPNKTLAIQHNSGNLYDMLQTCYGAAGNRWANFVAVDFYKRSDGGGSFEATDKLNGELLCGSKDVHSCADGSNYI